MPNYQSEKLPNAPLQEVIFELLWDIGFDQQGNPFDPEYEFAQGIFGKEVLKNFPVKKRTIPEGIPLKIYPKTIHQFWKSEKTWPVIQLGPGIMAINDTENNYRWKESFYPLINKYTGILEDSYDKKLSYKNCSLRYIDAVEITENERNELLNYVNSKFNFNLFNKFDYPGTLSHLNLSQTYDVDIDTKVSLILNDGVNKFNKPAVIWQTHIVTNTRKNKDEVLSWVDKAHEITSNLFKNIVNKDFYDSFK